MGCHGSLSTSPVLPEAYAKARTGNSPSVVAVKLEPPRDPGDTGLSTQEGGTMATSQSMTEYQWHQRVEYWMFAVLDQRRQFPWLELRSCALQVPFPRNRTYKVLQLVWPPLATWLMRRLLLIAAADLGVQVSSAELEILTQVALILIQATL